MTTEAEAFVAVEAEEVLESGAAQTYPRATAMGQILLGSAGVVVARLHGFDLDDRPLVLGLEGRPHDLVKARTTVPLLAHQAGSEVLVLFERGNFLRPIIVGVLQDARPSQSKQVRTPSTTVNVQADGECVVVSAEREIVLSCGAASITLTRAGKVIIQGKYVLSRSSGYNKIKGAAVDIN